MGFNKRATNWSASTDIETVRKRAGGRRRYNAWRRFQAQYRKRQIIDLLFTMRAGLTDRGIQSRIAKKLGVHRSTVHRDFKELMAQSPVDQPCPFCGCRVFYSIENRIR